MWDWKPRVNMSLNIYPVGNTKYSEMMAFQYTPISWCCNASTSNSVWVPLTCVSQSIFTHWDAQSTRSNDKVPQLTWLVDTLIGKLWTRPSSTCLLANCCCNMALFWFVSDMIILFWSDKSTITDVTVGVSPSADNILRFVSNVASKDVWLEIRPLSIEIFCTRKYK